MFDVELSLTPSIPIATPLFSAASVSAVLDTSSTNICAQAPTIYPSGTGHEVLSTGVHSIGTGYQVTGTGSTGYVSRPTGLGWNASNTRNFSEPRNPSAILQPSSSVFAVPTSAIQVSALSMGSTLDPFA